MDLSEKLRELNEDGYCVLASHLQPAEIDACRVAFAPKLLAYLGRHGRAPNRGPHRHFMPMPFEPPIFAPAFFFDPDILNIVRSAMGERVVADQWGCDTPVRGSEYQEFHQDYRRPLFEEQPNLRLPPYMLVVSFGLSPITPKHGPIEVAPGTHRIPRDAALRGIGTGEIKVRSIPLGVGDVLIRHPWAMHRGTPNSTETPRPLLTIRYVRHWYADASRDVNAIQRTVWESLTEEQQLIMRFPVRD